ncbi:hypothetical protein [Methylobacterium sp. Leaf117]|uniref:hypothetical protein n=1 Tax=Methylobacterium sp. Leaf117 TaxID=1736260 RepID=UPI000AD034B1|nr:hypothetical protein [Methylobacterium sp. Leaf117]
MSVQPKSIPSSRDVEIRKEQKRVYRERLKIRRQTDPDLDLRLKEARRKSWAKERDRKGSTACTDIIRAIDRTGKQYNQAELQSVFEKIYSISPKALRLMFPDMSVGVMHFRARKYGIANTHLRFTAEEDAICRELYPNYEMMIARLGRKRTAIERRCAYLKLARRRGKLYTQAEIDMLRAGLEPPDHSYEANGRKRERLGIRKRDAIQVRALGFQGISNLVEPLISRGYPEDRRQDIIQFVFAECMEGRCSPDPTSLKACAKRAVTATYKLHPDRGAPVSLDAKLFDDGGTTVGDRIASDTFHF